jgi:hypothetical protein
MYPDESRQFPSVVSAADLRRMAMQCAVQADVSTGDLKERKRLLKMRKALLTLAENEDWLNGKADDT